MRQHGHCTTRDGREGNGRTPVPIWRVVSTAAVLSVAFCGCLVARLPIGVPGEWVLSYSADPLWGATAHVLPVFAVWGAIIYVGYRCAYRCGAAGRTAWSLSVTAAFCMLCTLSLFLNRYPVNEAHFVVASPNALGAYKEDAVTMAGPRSYLRDYHEKMRRPAEETKTHHTMTNPPGMALLLRAVFGPAERNEALVNYIRRRLELHTPPPPGDPVSAGGLSAEKVVSSVVRAIAATTVIIVLASLAYVPVYLLACEVSGVRTAPLVAGLALTVPNFHAFHPSKDAMQFVFIASMWLCALKALRTRRPAWALAAGLFFFLGSFFIFMCLPAAGVVGVVVLLEGWRSGRPIEWLRERWRPWLPTVLWGIAGAIVPYLLLYAWAGYNPILAALEGRRGLWRFFADNPRTYWAWILANISNWVVMGGGVLAALLGLGLYRQVGDVRRGGWRRLDPWLWGLVLTVVLLDFAAIPLSETARIWMFLSPAAVVAGARACRLEQTLTKGACLALLALAVLQLAAYLTMLDMWEATQRIQSGSLFW